MGVFDRIRTLFGGGDGGDARTGSGRMGDDQVGDGRVGVDRGAGTRRVGVDPDDDRKTGAHGAHWDPLLPTEELREATVEAVEGGDPVAGRPLDGHEVQGYRHPADGPVRTCTVAVDGTVATAYPTAEGMVHDATVTEVVDWANDVEAQLAVEVAGRRAGLFDAAYFARDRDYAPGDDVRLELAAFAYELEHTGGDGDVDPDAGPAEGPGVFVGFGGGDVDDYLFMGRVEAASRHRYRGRTVRRFRVPFVGDDVEIPVYAAERVIDGEVPQPGEEVEGVVWLQGRIVG